MAFTEYGNEGEFNDTTEVTIVEAPGAGIRRIIRSIMVSNEDTVSASITLRKYKGASIEFSITFDIEAGGFASIGGPVVLDATDENIKGVLGGAATANQPTFDSAYGDSTATAEAAPDDAQYFVLAVHGDLTNERRLMFNNPLSGTDSGAGGDYDVDLDVSGQTEEASPASGDWFLMERTSDGAFRKVQYQNLQGSSAPDDAQYLVLVLDGDLTSERRLVVNSPLSGSDGGAGGDYDVDLDVSGQTEETSPANGDWFLMERTSDGAFRKVQYQNIQSSAGYGVLSINIPYPSSSESIVFFFFFDAVTVQEVQAAVIGSSTPSLTIDFEHGSNASSLANDLLSSPTAITNTSGGQNLTSFDDATIAADSWFGFVSSAKSGVVEQFVAAIRYTLD